MALTASGQVRYTLKTPYRDGTTHIVLEPLDLIARLAALVLPPRMHLMRYHGVFAPHSRLRAAVTPAGRGRGGKPQIEEAADKPVTPRHVAMSWAQRLKRVFRVEIESCAPCGGKLKVIASIEEPQVMAKILAHLERSALDQFQSELPLGARALPVQPVCFECERWGSCRLKRRGVSACARLPLRRRGIGWIQREGGDLQPPRGVTGRGAWRVGPDESRLASPGLPT